MKQVFISSTRNDLQAYRDAARAVCSRLGLHAIMMEDFTAMGVGATEGSKRKLDEADVFVGIYAYRYGYIEDGYDNSVTEIEFDYAGERELDRLCFLVDPGYGFPEMHRDYENHERLVTFKAKVNKLIRDQFTDVNDFKAKLSDALAQWKLENNVSSAAPAVALAATAIFAKTASAVPEQPDTLIGRDDLLKRIHALLDQNHHVLLQGFGGMGKTVLAATIATQRAMPILWLKAGNAEADALFEALARPFNAQQAVASTTGNTKIMAMREVLSQSSTKLLVLDDAWNGEAIYQIMKAVPPNIPVLVTSRQLLNVGEFIEIDKLSPEDGLKLLNHFARKDFVTDGHASELCKRLGYLPFALEIAGSILKMRNWSPAKLLESIGDAPHDMKAPAHYSEKDRTSVKDLLDASLGILDQKSRSAFMAFGALFAPTATPELMTLYLDRDKGIVERALTSLQDYGLAKWIPETRDSIGYYRIHELAWSYAATQANDEKRNRALKACLKYIKRYNQPNPKNFAALRPELSNFLAAARWGMEKGRYADVEAFAWGLSGDSHMLSYQGYFMQEVELLNLAYKAAESQNKRQEQSDYLGQLGLVWNSPRKVESQKRRYTEVGSRNDDRHTTAIYAGGQTRGHSTV